MYEKVGEKKLNHNKHIEIISLEKCEANFQTPSFRFLSKSFLEAHVFFHLHGVLTINFQANKVLNHDDWKDIKTIFLNVRRWSIRRD